MSTPQQTIEQPNQFNKGYALLIGVADYAYLTKLNNNVLKDVQALVTLLKHPRACAYPSDHVKTLLNEQATLANIIEQLNWLANVTGDDDTAVIYFSGHGGQFTQADTTNNYLLPHDANPDNYGETAVSSDQFTTLLNNIPAKRVAVILDCCYAGGIGEAKSAETDPITYQIGLDQAALDKLSYGEGRVILASSRADERSWIRPNMPNSLFTHYLLEGLRGAAGTTYDDQILVTALFKYVDDQVSKVEPRQRPVFKSLLHKDFPIALAPPDDIPIEEDFHHRIPYVARPIFNKMFEEYRKLIFRRAYNRGWSGANIFELSPFRKGSNSAQLNTIVKFGPKPLIEQEWQAFDDYIKGNLPNIANIIGEPIYDPLDTWGAVRYPLVGAGVFETKSLGELFAELSIEDLSKTIPGWLFPSLYKLWDNHATLGDYSLRKRFQFWFPDELDANCTQLKELAKQHLSHLPTEAETVHLLGNVEVENPLCHFNRLLDRSLEVYVSPIHGDLNLENILVIRTENTLSIQLIDFASARRDYVLHDMLCLELGVLLNVLPSFVAAAHPDTDGHKPIELLLQLLYGLHVSLTQGQNDFAIDPAIEKPFQFLLACRKNCADYLKKKQDWSNYYICLIIYLLGAIGFRSLEVAEGKRPLPREFAFWGAVILNQLRLDHTKLIIQQRKPPAVPTQEQLTTPKQPPLESTSMNYNDIDQIQFKNFLVQHFSKAELNRLCDNLYLDPDEVEGISKTDRAMEIVKHFKRRLKLENLYIEAQKMRPEVNWEILISNDGNDGEDSVLDDPKIMTTTNVDSKTVVNFIKNNFSMEEMDEELCFAMDEKAGNIPRRSNIMGRAIAITTFFERRGRLQELYKKAKALRPGVQ